MGTSNEQPMPGIPDVVDSAITETGLIGSGESTLDIAPGASTELSGASYEGGAPTAKAINGDESSANFSPDETITSGIIKAYFSKDSKCIVVVQPPRTELERERTEKVTDPISNIEIDFTHSAQSDEVEVIGIKRKYLGDPSTTDKSAKKQRLLGAVSEFARILGNRDFDGKLHKDATAHTKPNKLKKA